MNRRVLLTRRPAGALTADCFEVDVAPVPDLQSGEVLVHNVFLSADPYLRLEVKTRQPLGEPVLARVAGEVARSADDRWQPGDLVWGYLGWEEYTVARATALQPAGEGPLSHTLSARGMNGLTAWAGMVEICRPKPGDTVVVSAGTGSVGSLAGQLARLAGARVVAVVGGERKVRHAVEALGYHDAVDRHAGLDGLDRACPDGVDAYFDNTGGEVTAAVTSRVNRMARIAVCGAISAYDLDGAPPPQQVGWLIGSGATATWYSVHDYMHTLPTVSARMGRLVAEGRLAVTEDVVHGVEQAPEALLGVLRGDNLGKRLVQVRPFDQR